MSFIGPKNASVKVIIVNTIIIVMVIFTLFANRSNFKLSNLAIYISIPAILVITFIFTNFTLSIVKKRKTYDKTKHRLMKVIIFIVLYFSMFFSLAIGIPSILVKHYGKDFSYEGVITKKDATTRGISGKKHRINVQDYYTPKSIKIIIIKKLWDSVEEDQEVSVSGKEFFWGKRILDVQLLKGVNYYHKRGKEHFRNDRYEKALSDFDRVIELNPKNAAAYNNKGAIYSAQKMYDLSLRNYSKAIDLNPRFSIAYHSRGVVYFKKGEYDKAILDYNRSIEFDPKYADAYNHRGQTYAIKSELEKACSDVTTGCKLGKCYGLDWAKEKGFCK